MLVAIYAYENIYGGCLGMNEFDIVEVNTMDEAEEIACDMSKNVMDSYDCIMAELKNMVKSELEFNNNMDKDDVWSDVIDENIAYVLYEVKCTCGKSIEELGQEFYDDKMGFIEKYCK